MRESLPFFIARPSARSGTAEELEKSGEKGKNRAVEKQKKPCKKHNRKDQSARWERAVESITARRTFLGATWIIITANFINRRYIKTPLGEDSGGV